MEFLGSHKSTGIVVFIDEKEMIIQLVVEEVKETFYYYLDGYLKNYIKGEDIKPTPFMLFFGNLVFNNYYTFLELIKNLINEKN